MSAADPYAALIPGNTPATAPAAPPEPSAPPAATSAAISEERLLRASLRPLALAAGVHPDAVAMLDTSGLALADDDTVAVPDGFFEAAREANPWQFIDLPPATGAAGGTTASRGREPGQVIEKPPTLIDARHMSDAEYRAFGKTLGISENVWR